MHIRRSHLLLLAVLAIDSNSYTFGQTRNSSFDSTYVQDYSHQFTGRIYLSSKFNALTIASQAGSDLVYRPNNKVNIGIGGSYRALTLNIGFGIPFVNNDQAVRGRTRYLDAQANIHTQRWAANLFLQVFEGYYISSHEPGLVGWVQDTELPYREDLIQFNIGASALRVLNDKRFSYRAAFNQDAWQRKSQGSLLLGGYTTFFTTRADSSLVPSSLMSQFNSGASLRTGRFFDLGALAGYAYTFVWKEHWFATASLAAGPGLSIRSISTGNVEQSEHRTDLGPGWHAQLRTAVGYNSRRDQIALSFNQEQIGYLLADQGRFRWSVSNIRLNFAHRFNRRVREVDKGIRWFRKKVVEPLEPGS